MPVAAPAPVTTTTDRLDLAAAVPASPGRIVVEGCNGTCTEALHLDFTVASRVDVPRGELFVELLEADGRRCATASVSGVSLRAGETASLATRSLTLDRACAAPVRIASLRATLRDEETWRGVLGRQFAAEYTLEPADGRPPEPAVIKLTWGDDATGGARPPKAGGSATIECEIEERDGIGLTMTATLEGGAGGWLWVNQDDGSKATTVTSPCAPQRAPHAFEIGFRAGGPTRAVVTCSGVDWRGRASKPRSVVIPVCCAE